MTSSYIAEGVISPENLKAALDAGTRIRLIDASYALPASSENPHQNYLAKRIGEAVFFPIDEIKDRQSDLPHMLPSADDFSEACGKLGIGNNDFIVIYGQGPIAMGPARAWWMFRVFGHDAVCVLDGGLNGWEAAGFTVNMQAPPAPAKTVFRASFRPELVRDLAQMRAASAGGDALILDARPPGRFSGTENEPRPGLRSGHIPGSVNVPAGSLLDAQGCMKNKSELHAIFGEAGFDGKKPVYASCGSGVTACAIALGLYRTGYRDVAVYDGSWSEWGLPGSGAPVSRSGP